MTVRIIKLGKKYGVQFSFGVQYFTLNYVGTKKEVGWMVQTLNKRFKHYERRNKKEDRQG